MIGGGNDRLFTILCHRLSRPDLATSPLYSTNAARVANRATLEPLIESITSLHPTSHWLAVFEGSGMPYAAINDIQATLNHEHARARGMVQAVEHGACGEIRVLGSPVKYSEARPGVRRAPPTLGEHTGEVLRGVLGLEEEEVEKLRGEGVVA